ncbi:Serine/threonine-protein kinase SZE1 [Cardamine amara subsp. amara]|uniref:Serine/threonine-protein kinase SZE1 n=1 Tax=Cardamine amara subsp. amara TaxID=228776 RepID=A0ABD1C4A4_CARAN
MGNCFSPSAPSVLDVICVVEEGMKVYTVAELKKVTKNFGKEMVIRDSYGKVVKGYINPKTLSPAKEGVGMAVAVKRFYLTNDQALQEWLVDLEFLRHNSHPSLVKLIGYSSDLGMLFVVSEYFSNGSLEDHIYRESRPKSLPWVTRIKISIGAAQCLAFLHSKKNAGLYRTYLTASKILLDMEFNARVSYFGLKTLPSDDEGPHFQLCSYAEEPQRFHYAPPEYIISGMSNMAGDVYSFGVILLEIITGFGKKRIILAKRAIRNEKEHIVEMIDPDLENSYPHDEGLSMCEIIKQCLEEDPQKRPSMQQVFDNLSAIAKV